MPDPRIGVAVLVVKGDCLLIGRRTGSHGSGTLQAPGGHLEFGEEWEECARRELLEETGLVSDRYECKLFHVTNDIFESENKHYITLFMKIKVDDSVGDPKVLEPEKCEFWKWMNWRNLYESRADHKFFKPIINLMQDKEVVDRLTE
ncbi:hypothetical protein AKO1_014684 [Acrasis kona]|uniref:Nudix hydrolase domain-containing protein n=1 Tax=Acrasis kona TaxID=1008807 RepID=A0AAW2Z1V3_9EUKA